MSEEARKPRTTIPWALIASITLNGTLGFGMVIALLYCQGDYMQNLESETGFPFLEAFMQSLRSLPWATAYASILLVLLIFACIAVLAATSRSTYAYARYDTFFPPSLVCEHLLIRRFAETTAFLSHTTSVTSTSEPNSPSGPFF